MIENSFPKNYHLASKIKAHLIVSINHHTRRNSFSFVSTAKIMSLPQQNIHRAVEAGLWFDDGNIILIAEDTPFKVHRGMLMHTSEVLKDILSIPQPPVLDDSEMMDGIAIVHVSDTWKDLSYMLSALYGGYKSALPHTCYQAHSSNMPC